MSDYVDLIRSAMNDDPVAFRQAFDAAIKPKVHAALNEKYSRMAREDDDSDYTDSRKNRKRGLRDLRRAKAASRD
jgi:hypothetical protein